jgi:hypothetical protein
MGGKPWDISASCSADAIDLQARRHCFGIEGNAKVIEETVSTQSARLEGILGETG